MVYPISALSFSLSLSLSLSLWSCSLWFSQRLHANMGVKIRKGSGYKNLLLNRQIHEIWLASSIAILSTRRPQNFITFNQILLRKYTSDWKKIYILYDFLGMHNLTSVSSLNILELKNLKYNERFSFSFYLSCER